MAEAVVGLAAVIEVCEDCESLSSHDLLQLLVNALVRCKELFHLHLAKKSILEEALELAGWVDNVGTRRGEHEGED